MMNAGPNVQRRLDLVMSELDTLYQASRLLGRHAGLVDALRPLLKLLHEEQSIRHGMVGLFDAGTGVLQLNALHDADGVKVEEIAYKPGEGIVGLILEQGESIVVPRIREEPRFLDRLGVYNPELPFIGVPIFMDDEPAGVLAGQPPAGNELLGERVRFLEMIGSLIAQSLRLVRAVENERQVLKSERDTLRRTVRSQHGFENMVGHTDVMRRVFEQVRLVAKWNSTVLIRGESGTGKELVANAIHYNSPRVSGPFVRLNCAALPDNLLESELFGHEKGAFTGAVAQRSGRFEMADGGTLFLDEIGEISAAFQAKLLRVLQEGEFERVGGTQTLKVDVRIIAATNRQLEDAVERGDFREDLYYRLNVMPIHMPSLSERLEDIPDLARHLVLRIADKQGRKLTITDGAIRVLLRHSWPGNVRELENCLERAAVMSEEGIIDVDVITLTGVREKTASAAPPAVPVTAPAPVNLDDPSLSEREMVIAALEEAGWVQAKAARLLHMTPRQIAYRIQTLNIKVRQI